MGLALAACGSDGDGGDGGESPGNDFADGSVEEIKDAAIADMKALESMTMDGSLTQEGGELELTLSMDTDGNCLGTITQAGGTAEFIGADGVFFLKGDETFWRGNTDPAKADAVVKLVAGKWVNLGTDGGGFSELCDLDSFIDDLPRTTLTTPARNTEWVTRRRSTARTPWRSSPRTARRRPRRWWPPRVSTTSSR